MSALTSEVPSHGMSSSRLLLLLEVLLEVPLLLPEVEMLPMLVSLLPACRASARPRTGSMQKKVARFQTGSNRRPCGGIPGTEPGKI